MPAVIKDSFIRLSFDQKDQQLRYEMRLSFETSRNTTTFSSFDWYKVSTIWANSFKDKENIANVLSNLGAGIGTSCGGKSISICGNGKGFSSGVRLGAELTYMFGIYPWSTTLCISSE